MLFALLCVACNSSQSDKKNTEEQDLQKDGDGTDASSSQEETEVVFVSVIDELRVRSAPDTKSEVLGELKFNQRTLYLNEKSDFKQKIVLRGKAKTDTWKKIKFIKSGESIHGWVFGGGLVEESKLYREDGEGTWVRDISRAKVKEISELLEIELHPDFYYSGFIHYKAIEDSGNNRYLKHASFKLVGKSKGDDGELTDSDIGAEFTGQFVNNRPNGKFKKRLNRYENQFTSVLNFENGIYTFSEVTGSAEGDDYYHKEDNPKGATFYYIEEQMWSNLE